MILEKINFMNLEKINYWLTGFIVGATVTAFASLLPNGSADNGKPLSFPPTSGEHLVLPTEIYDGDTFTFCWLVKDKARTFGINAPEVTGKQKPEGIKSRDYFLSIMPLNKPITIRVYNRDKYGRCLAEPLNASGKGIGEIMVEHGFAKPWDGRGVRP